MPDHIPQSKYTIFISNNGCRSDDGPPSTNADLSSSNFFPNEIKRFVFQLRTRLHVAGSSEATSKATLPTP